MKKNLRLTLLLFLNFAIFIPYAKSQIILEQELLDSILSITVDYYKDYISKNPVSSYYPIVTKIGKETNSLNTIITSSIWIRVRTDIPEGSFIYLQNQKIHFLIIDQIPVNSKLKSKLISHESSCYKGIIDSIRMPDRPLDGVYTQRAKLVVYRFKRKGLFKKYFVVTSQSFIPYQSAPIQFKPVINFSDDNNSHEISFYYYGNRMRLNEKYYKDIKPIKPIKFRLSRKKN